MGCLLIFHFLQDRIEFVEPFLPEAPEIERPVGDSLDRGGAERADALSPASSFDHDLCAHQAGYVLGDHLLREREGLSEIANGGRSEGQLDDHGAPGWVSKCSEG